MWCIAMSCALRIFWSPSNLSAILRFLKGLYIRLDHIFIWLGLAPPMPPSLHNLPTHTYVGTLRRWESM